MTNAKLRLFEQGCQCVNTWKRAKNGQGIDIKIFPNSILASLRGRSASLASIMKVLNAAALLIIFMKCVIASRSLDSKLHRAIDWKDYATVKEICQQDQRTWDIAIDYVIQSKPLGSIVEFIEKTDQVNGFTLIALYENGKRELTREVFKKVNFTDDDMIFAMSSNTITCSPEDFLRLLGKMRTGENQEAAVKKGIGSLFDGKRTDCIDPLLNALEGKRFLSNRIREIVIRTAFKEGAESRSGAIWAKYLHDSPEITTKVYSKGLIHSGRKSTKDPSFRWLLDHADYSDLMKVIYSDGFPDEHHRFRDTITGALSTTKPRGTRLDIISKKIEILKDVLRGFDATQLPDIIGDIVGTYMTEYDEGNDRGQQQAREPRRRSDHGRGHKGRRKRSRS